FQHALQHAVDLAVDFAVRDDLAQLIPVREPDSDLQPDSDPVELPERVGVGVAQSLGISLQPVDRDLLVLLVVRDRLTLLEHVGFRLVVGNLSRR
ncbi:MAG TPA: hypothetical protein VJ347_04070, partial [Streptosporangiaceae bacterium]|nr:hypothetical protein [Streptosporangiaceae bacterium]